MQFGWNFLKHQILLSYVPGLIAVSMLSPLHMISYDSSDSRSMYERTVDSGLSPRELEHSTLSAPLLRHGTLALRTGSPLVGRWPIAGGGLATYSHQFAVYL